METDGDKLDFEELKKEKSRCIIELKSFAFVIQECLVELYGMADLVKSRVHMELLHNFVTSLVLSGPIYIFIFNLIALGEYE